MAGKMFVLLHADTLTERLLKALAALGTENLVTTLPEKPDRPALLLVRCTQVEAMAYGLVRLGFGDGGRPPAVEVRAGLLVGILEPAGPLPVGFLTD